MSEVSATPSSPSPAGDAVAAGGTAKERETGNPPPKAGKPGRFFRRRAIWWPTWRIWLPALALVLAAGALAARNLHGWLAVTEPVPDAKYVAVEGWAPDYVLQQAVFLAEDTEAQRVFCTGMPLERGSFIFNYGTYARYGAETMAKMGLDPGLICPVPAPKAPRERTRVMAEALRDVLVNEPVPATGKRVNVVTQGAHARRSRAIFQDVLGPEWRVGIVSVPPSDYEPEKWYLQSSGQRMVLSELVALTLRLFGLN